MGVALKSLYEETNEKSKQEFERAFMYLMDSTRIIDQKVSTMTDKTISNQMTNQQKKLQQLQLSVDDICNRLNLMNQKKNEKKNLSSWFKTIFR